MTEYVFEFMGWVDSRYGWAGQLCVVLISVGMLIGILWLIQKLPVPKDQALCNSCKYENPNENSVVYCCPHYIKCRAFQMRAAKCPHADKLFK